MTTLFNFKLYLEGIKKIRLVGIIVGIIVLIGNALPPIVMMLENRSIISNGYTVVTEVVSASDFAIPSIAILFLTPFFFFSMYSFLNKRNESDFYHAIPYKRSCVLFSFLASIYTWIWGIMLLSLLLTGMLWAICPGYTFAFSVIPLLFGVYAATTLYLGSFFLLAMTLTGTTVSNIAVSAILLFFVRIVGALTSFILEDMVFMMDIAYTPMRFISMRYWLPASIISSFYDASVFRNGGLWFYSIIVMALVYALAIFCYCRRRSESANKSAVNRKLQHVFRCAFTLPLALLTAYLICTNEDISFIVVLIIITLTTYYLYELITTKNLRMTFRATPLLLVPVICSGIIIGGCYMTRAAVLESAYTTDEIAAVRTYRYSSILDLFVGSSNTYEDLATGEITIPDREAAKLVSDTLEKNIKVEKGEESYRIAFGDSTTGIRIEITLKSGRKVGRYLIMSDGDYRRLQEVLYNSEEYRKAYISLPESKNIQSINATLLEDASDKDLRRLWDTFANEYNALSDEEKVEFKNQYRNSYYGGWDYGYVDEYYPVNNNTFLTQSLRITVRGSIGVDSFYSSYYIPESFTQTRALYYELCAPARNTMRETLATFANGGYDDILMSQEYYSYMYCTLNVGYGSNGFVTEFSSGNYHFIGSEDDISVILNRTSYERAKRLLGELLPYLTDTPDDEHFCIISFNMDYEGRDHGYHYDNRNAIFGLSDLPEDLAKELTQVSDGGTDPEMFLGVLKSYAEGELSGYIDMISREPYSDSVLDFLLDVPNGEIDSIKLYLETNSYNFQNRFDASKDFCALLLTHLRTEPSDDAPECRIQFYTYDNSGNWIGMESSFGLVPFEGEELAKLEELASMIGSYR